MIEAHLDAPNVGDLEKKYLGECINSAFVSTFGPFVSEFENKFAKYICARRAVSVQSGTAALHMALYGPGIGEGDEVIVPALTFIATVNSVLYVGAKPVIVDVDSETWNVDTKKIEESITEKTKAIIPVHLYGSPCDMDEILKLANKHNIYVIEDATESLGATYKGRQTGTLGHFGCFSFNGNKLMTTGGGGMIVSNNETSIERIKFLVNQARDKSKGYYHPEMGFNYRMTNIEAALGLAQFERLDEFLEKKKRFRQIYKRALGDMPQIKFQKEYEKAEGSWWLTCVKIGNDMDIDNVIKELEEKGVQTRRVFMPVCEMPYLREYAKHCPNAYEIYEKGICLPSSTLNSTDTIKKASLMIRETLNA